jgi:chromosome condensin MukBEF ATPase and DNA-binding subunit MukB
MRPLYEIDAAILAAVDQETGEIFDGEKLTALQMEREAKLEGVALWVKDLKAEAEAVKAEADKLNARKKALDSKIDSIKTWLMYALNGEKLKTPRCNVYQTHSTKLNVIDEQSVVNWIQTHSREPEQYLKFTLPEIRKDAVKAAIKDGAEIPGACLEQTESVVIK